MEEILLKNKTGKCKILLIGDSHIKGLSSELRYNLGDTCDILGIVKPNANTKQLTTTSVQEVKKLTQKDILVLRGDTNDISKNNARNGLIQEVNYLRNNQQTNNIVITVPHRFDLEYNSCVNEEVRKFNRSLSKMANNLNKVTVVYAQMEREYYTRHGLHYNRKGKKIMAKKI
jgi:hypothetical protein